MRTHLRLLTSDEYPWELLLEADPSRRQIECYLPKSSVFGLFLEESLIGVVAVAPLQGGDFEIFNIAVAQEYRGRGFGKILLKKAINFARRSGARRLIIGTGNSSIGQLYLYQKVGFRIIGIVTDYFLELYENPIVENGIPCRDMLRLSLDLTSLPEED